ncbi:hypothetical protein GCM10011574_10900 [Microbispora bryophytorum]|uniref:Uncharacterized protein n=1 Tax=Microbispora bryophytorum TaxID=1460882 RepID=A0A8H9GUY5_9ACTN|nr:hypothetical protein GCM10011574_10900 [Microbispora bryophytorum]
MSGAGEGYRGAATATAMFCLMSQWLVRRQKPSATLVAPPAVLAAVCW